MMAGSTAAPACHHDGPLLQQRAAFLLCFHRSLTRPPADPAAGLRPAAARARPFIRLRSGDAAA